MSTDHHRTYMLSGLKDVVIFSLTVAVCTLLMAAGDIFSNGTQNAADPILAPSVPTPPALLLMSPEPKPVSPEIELALALPEINTNMVLNEIEMIFTLPDLDLILAGGETISQRSSAPKAARPSKPIPFYGIIAQVAGRYEVDPHLIRAIILAESGYNPKAISKKGARGLMQLMPSTAKSLGVQDIYDPEENIDGGVRYFRSLLDRFDGDVRLALAAYNAGSRHVRNYEGIPPFKATQRYVKKVLKFHEKFKMETQLTS